jgi:hypothetical protein
MFTPPSVNQIASTYKGNPAPLNAKVQTDRKQNGGIPSDLRQLMAAYDLSQGRQNMGIQQALQIPTNMPTVAEDVQERARQALQARQMQAMQEMQRKNGQPNTVPMGTPRPPMQAQGLDSLETNVGEGYAHGGIIGFDGVTGSDVKDPAEKNKSWIERFLYSNISPAERARKDALESQAEVRRTVPTRINEERDRNMAIVNMPDPNKTQEMLERLGMATRQEQPTQQVIGQTPPKADAPPAPPREKPAAQAQTRVNTDSAPMPAGLKDLAGIPSMGVGRSYERDRLREDPAKAMADMKALYDKEVGQRDLSIYDQMAEQLKGRKERLNAPKAGYDATMELLEQIAASGGRNWMEAGSKGVAGQRALQKSRLSEQDLLMEKILDLGAKKSDALFAEKKGMFDLTQGEKNRIIKDKQEIAKSLGLSEDKERELIQTALENEKNRLNQIRAAQIGAQDRDNLMSRARALMAADPTKKMTLEQAMQRAGEIGNAGAMDAADARRLATFNADKEKINSRMEFIPMLLDKKNDPKFAAAREKYAAEIRQARIDAGLPAAGLNALPTSTGLPAGVTVTQVK